MSLNETRISMMLTILSSGDTAFQNKGCAQTLNGDIVLGTQSMPCIVSNCQSDDSFTSVKTHNMFQAVISNQQCCAA